MFVPAAAKNAHKLRKSLFCIYFSFLYLYVKYEYILVSLTCVLFFTAHYNILTSFNETLFGNKTLNKMSERNTFKFVICLN